MILVDSSAWIDFFNGRISRETDELDRLLAREALLTGDLVLAEVLQGFRRDADFRRARDLLARLEYVDMLGREVALLAAENYRALRRKGRHGTQDDRRDDRQLLPAVRPCAPACGPRL